MLQDTRKHLRCFFFISSHAHLWNFTTHDFAEAFLLSLFFFIVPCLYVLKPRDQEVSQWTQADPTNVSSTTTYRSVVGNKTSCPSSGVPHLCQTEALGSAISKPRSLPAPGQTAIVPLEVQLGDPTLNSIRPHSIS